MLIYSKSTHPRYIDYFIALSAYKLFISLGMNKEFAIMIKLIDGKFLAANNESRHSTQDVIMCASNCVHVVVTCIIYVI